MLTSPGFCFKEANLFKQGSYIHGYYETPPPLPFNIFADDKDDIQIQSCN